eukprot:CAMPEP_0172177882 /NCGR_PEP_ID=MMETSP1050-20130122/15708_1 /TAXON_ID=233186 /ORGANISM="Cryptomonas curvata, Strain CCAP979/52" /LENGTH=180 /DNA_ID=CAMNT_0012850501 /DNA_START=165 /DNA_END=704 /DNA_ORIENTATION=-
MDGPEDCVTAVAAPPRLPVLTAIIGPFSSGQSPPSRVRRPGGPVRAPKLTQRSGHQASADSRTAALYPLQSAITPGGHAAEPRTAPTNSRRAPPLLCTQPSNSASIVELLSRLSRQTDSASVTSPTEKTVGELSMKTQRTICATEKHIICALSSGVSGRVGTKAETTAVGTQFRHMSKST